MAQTEPAGDRTPLRLRVADEVASWMGRRRMRQAAVARLLGISQPSVSARLRGHAAFSLDELDQLADAFGIDPSVLTQPGEHIAATQSPQVGGANDSPTSDVPRRVTLRLVSGQ